ncbi:MAG: SprT family zinc-dependent metalloprotease [Solirubrobacteraceae bacterium]
MEPVVYQVRRSDRARRVRVTVDPTRGIEVVLPRRAAAREAAAAVRELRPWIERRVAEIEGARAAVAARGETVPYLGRTLALSVQDGRSRVTRRGDVLVVPDGEARTPALERWYRRAARAEIEPRLQRACALAGTSYSRLTIRGQRTRWASCSRSGAMSFNWRLLLAPEPVLDYVVWHEVCHLEVMDHSPRFWRLVAARSPGYREHVRWLRANGPTLVL